MKMFRFRFCPNCKNSLPKMYDRLIDCTKCGFHFYFSPSPTNALILENKKREILLVKKKIAPKTGQWDLPGGFVEYNETIEESLRREIKEELDLDIKNFQYMRSYTGIYPYKGFMYRPLCFVFRAFIHPEEIRNIKVGDDASGFQFFSYSHVPWDDIAFPDVKNGLKDYIRLSSSK